MKLYRSFVIFAGVMVLVGIFLATVVPHLEHIYGVSNTSTQQTENIASIPAMQQPASKCYNVVMEQKTDGHGSMMMVTEVPCDKMKNP